MKNDCIYNIVRASGVSAGERVLIHFWGEDSEKSIANTFVAAVASLGATPVLIQQARTVNFEIFKSATETCFDDAYFESLSKFDAVLDVFAYRPIILGYELNPDQMALYRRYISNLFHALMKARRFAQIRVPTRANAEESGLDPDEYIHRMESAYSIDYDALRTECASAAERLALSDKYILRTGRDCALHFDLTGRTWHIDAGDGDWPCGEIYIAPVEAATNGTVFFDVLHIEDTGRFENVTLEFRNGLLFSSDCAPVSALIQSLSPADRTLCELGLGMNPGVGSLCGYTVLDEKKRNTFHIAIGANHMFGGQNASKMHMDFVSPGSFDLAPEP